MPGEGMALAGPIQSKGAAVGGTTLRRVGSATLQGRVGIPDGRRPPTAIGGARRTDKLLTSPRSESGQNCSVSAKAVAGGESTIRVGMTMRVSRAGRRSAASFGRSDAVVFDEAEPKGLHRVRH
jgi:hypothetical protein